MRQLVITLDATDTPKTIATLAGLTAKFDNIAMFRIYAEGTNNSGANGSARIGTSTASRAGAIGEQLLPGITGVYPSVGVAGVYDFGRIYITGETADKFTILYWIL